MGFLAASDRRLRKISSEPVVVPPGELIETTTPFTASESPTRFMSLAVASLPAMKPETEMRAICGRTANPPVSPARMR